MYKLDDEHNSGQVLNLEANKLERPYTARTEQLKLSSPSQAKSDAMKHKNDFVRSLFKENSPPADETLSSLEKKDM